MAKPLTLPTVTLACVDTRHPEQAWWAIQRCLSQVNTPHTIFFAPSDWSPAQADPRVNVRAIAALQSIADYNRFMLRDIAEHIQTEHVLVMQWDGFISTPSLWSSDFLEWDYIGAPWYHGNSGGTVGNGGFSLRSRKLLTALHSLTPDEAEPEDRTICVTLRPLLESRFGIRFAPLDIAQRFSCEYGTYRPTFGFHGMLNFTHTMSATELNQWLDEAPIDLLCSQHARKLVKTLMQTGRSDAALDLLRRRAMKLGWGHDQILLAMRAWLWKLTSIRR